MNLFRIFNSVSSPAAAFLQKNIATKKHSMEMELQEQFPSPRTDIPKTKTRFEEDFKELQCIGKGSFGEVVKAQRRLDGLCYAIKRIKIRQSSTLQRISREVTTLSRLSHPHVLRYYQSWIEEAADDNTEVFTLSDDEDEDDSYYTGMGDSSSYYNQKGNSYNSNQNEDNSGNENSKILVLYIQTEFCQTTLRNVIEEGAILQDIRSIWDLFRQMLEGLSYIHSQHIIHRDLKPENIFLSDFKIKIGDFGLARPHHIHLKNRVSTQEKPNFMEINKNVTSGVGTFFYKSPELLTQTLYSSKVDVFALGITFFELWHPFKKRSERQNVLQRLRDILEFPKGFQNAHPRQNHLLKMMLEPNPDSRASVQDLLKSEFLPPKSEEYIVSDALKLLENSDSQFFQSALEAMFRSARPFSENQDSRVLPETLHFHKNLVRIRNKAVETMVGLGVSCLKSSSLFEEARDAKINENIFQNPRLSPIRVLGYEGAVIQLRQNMRRQFKHFLKNENVLSGLEPDLRVFEVNDIISKDKNSPIPVSHTVLDYNLVIPSKHNSHKHIESAFDVVLKCILTSRSVGISQLSLNFSNLKVLAELAGVHKLESQKGKTLYRLVKGYKAENDKISFSKNAEKEGFSTQTIKLLFNFLEVLTIQEFQSYLKKLIGNYPLATSWINEVQEISKELEHLNAITTGFNIKEKIFEMPEIKIDLLALPASFDFDISFGQFSLEAKREGVKRSPEVLAVGGAFKLPETMYPALSPLLKENGEESKKANGFGFSLNLSFAAEFHMRANYKPLFPYSVLITSMGNAEEAVKEIHSYCVMSMIPSFIVRPEEFPATDILYFFSTHNEIQVLVLVKEKIYNSTKKFTVKARSLTKMKEEQTFEEFISMLERVFPMNSANKQIN